MQMIMCGVFDSAVQAYGQPIFVRSRGEAVRSFTDEINRKDERNALYAHPDDYTLSVLGTFDQATGGFASDIQILCRGKDVRTDDTN